MTGRFMHVMQTHALLWVDTHGARGVGEGLGPAYSFPRDHPQHREHQSRALEVRLGATLQGVWEMAMSRQLYTDCATALLTSDCTITAPYRS
jgi:hypothetical protein